MPWLYILLAVCILRCDKNRYFVYFPMISLNMTAVAPEWDLM